MISTHLLVHNGGEKHTAIRNIKIGAFFLVGIFLKKGSSETLRATTLWPVLQSY